MGLFDSLFTPSTKNNTTGTSATSQNSSGQQIQNNQATSQQSTDQTQTQKTTGATTSVSSQNSVAGSAGSNVVTQLDETTKAYLTKLLPSLFGNAAGAAVDNTNATKLKAISDALFTKASGTNATDVAKAVAASTDKANLDFQTGEGAQIGGIKQAIGSTENTYSKLIDQKGANDLRTQIAQIVASGALQADQLNSSDFAASADALVKASSVGANDQTAGLNPLLSVISLLKGADTVSNSNTNTTENKTGTTGTTTEENTLATLLSSIFGSTQGTSDTEQSGTLNQVGNTTGTEKGSSSKGIIGDILSIF